MRRSAGGQEPILGGTCGQRTLSKCLVPFSMKGFFALLLLLLLLLLAVVSAAATSADHAAVRFSAAIQLGDFAAVKQLSQASGFNASATIIDRFGRPSSPIEAALNALQRFLAVVAAKGFGRVPPGVAGAAITSHLSIISLLAKHSTANVTTACPLRLATHYRIFPAMLNIIDAAPDSGLSCILQRDLHGRTLVHVAAASKAAGLSSLLNPSHSLHHSHPEHHQSYELLMSTLRLRRPVSHPASSLIRAATLPVMNSNLAAHELDIFIRLSFLTSHHLDIRDNLGRTALHVAASCAHARAAQRLIDGGADVNARDSAMRSALHVACSNHAVEVAQCLVQHGADLNAQDMDGNTALHLSAINFDGATFELLFLHGANAEILNNLNQTACASAQRHIGPDLLMFQNLCGSSAFAQNNSCAHGVSTVFADASSGGWGPATAQPPEPSLSCPFEVVDVHSNMSASTFLSSFVSLQRPVIIKGLGLRTLAAHLWTKATFAQRWGSLNVTVSAVPHAQSYGQASYIMPLEVFMKLHMNGSNSSGAYVFDGNVLDAEPELRSECPPPPVLHGTRVVLSQFFVGDAGTGSFPHFHGHALNVLVHGQKQWFFFPPNHAHFNVKSIGHWIKEDWGSISKRKDAAQRAGAAMCAQDAGDAVYVPQYWGHAVYNTAPSIGVAYEFDV
jgi:hypothetical protein